METSDYLREGYLLGWPGRSTYMLTTAGTQLFRFVPGGDQIVPITDTYFVTLKAEKRFNHLLGKDERGGYRGNLQAYYPDFLYEVLQIAQKRVIDCLRSENRDI